MKFNLQQKKEIERLANITPNLTDFGTKGLTSNGAPKQGYCQLRDARVIKTSQLYITQSKQAEGALELETLAAAKPHLKDLKNIATKKDGSLKNGFYKTADNKVVSIKQLKVVDAQIL